MTYHEYDLTRNDKPYELTIPNFTRTKQCVYYEFRLRDLVKNKSYTKMFRFKQLKEYHEKLKEMPVFVDLYVQLQLPEFPKTHIWKKTNSDPMLIKERKGILLKYFSIIVNDPFTRGTQCVKRFIAEFKGQSRPRRTFSSQKMLRTEEEGKSKSLQKTDTQREVNLKDLLRKK